jgi:hypothetical protein
MRRDGEGGGEYKQTGEGVEEWRICERKRSGERGE